MLHMPLINYHNKTHISTISQLFAGRHSKNFIPCRHSKRWNKEKKQEKTQNKNRWTLPISQRNKLPKILLNLVFFRTLVDFLVIHSILPSLRQNRPEKYWFIANTDGRTIANVCFAFVFIVVVVNPHPFFTARLTVYLICSWRTFCCFCSVHTCCFVVLQV